MRHVRQLLSVWLLALPESVCGRWQPSLASAAVLWQPAAVSAGTACLDREPGGYKTAQRAMRGAQRRTARACGRSAGGRHKQRQLPTPHECVLLAAGYSTSGPSVSYPLACTAPVAAFRFALPLSGAAAAAAAASARRKEGIGSSIKLKLGIINQWERGQ